MLPAAKEIALPNLISACEAYVCAMCVPSSSPPRQSIFLHLQRRRRRRRRRIRFHFSPFIRFSRFFFLFIIFILARSLRRHTLVFIIFHFMRSEMRWNELIVFSSHFRLISGTSNHESSLSCSKRPPLRCVTQTFRISFEMGLQTTMPWCICVFHYCSTHGPGPVHSAPLPHISIYLNGYWPRAVHLHFFSIFSLSSFSSVHLLRMNIELVTINMKMKKKAMLLRILWTKLSFTEKFSFLLFVSFSKANEPKHLNYISVSSPRLFSEEKRRMDRIKDWPMHAGNDEQMNKMQANEAQ